MKIPERISVLEEKKKDLHLRIEALEAENAPDASVTKLKKEKLKIKDEIALLTAYYESDSGIEYFG